MNRADISSHCSNHATETPRPIIKRYSQTGVSAIFLLAVVMASVSVVPTGAVAAAPIIDLPGTLTLEIRDDPQGTSEAWDFTYTEMGWSTVLTGLLRKPLGGGPFPAVVLNHGKGGNGVGFAIAKGPWFIPNGYAVISPDLTHAGNVFCMDEANQCGGTTENVHRGRRAAEILRSQELIDLIGEVTDRDNVFLYGNSLGGLTAYELAQALGSELRAVAISAGGVVTRNSILAYMTPSGTDGAADIFAPVMQLHGRIDNVIFPNEGQALADSLELYGKEHQMVWFPAGGHNISKAQTTTEQVRDFILDWFSAYRDHTEPAITNMTPGSGAVGAAVTVTGTNFGSNVDNASSVRFNGVTAVPDTWSDSLIDTTVPSGAVTGPLEMIVPVGPTQDPVVEQPVLGGLRSNRIMFDVTGGP